MKKVTFTPKHTVHVQYSAGTPIEVVVDSNGQAYYPFPTPLVGAIPAVSKSVPEAEEDVADEAPAKPKAVTPTKVSGKTYTEKQLMEMDTKDLEKICSSMGIDPDATEGKNTHKKLRLLVLENQSESEPTTTAPTKKAQVQEEDEEQEEAPASGVAAKIEAIISKLDEGDLDEAKAQKELVALGASNANKVKAIITEMMDNADLTIKDIVKKLTPLFGAKDVAEEAPASGGRKKSVPKEELISDFDELEEGDKIKVLWPDDAYYYGTVKSTGRKGVLVKYADGEEDYLDENVFKEVYRTA